MNTVDRKIMSQAKALLMNKFKLTDQEAYEYIRHIAMDTHSSKRKIAERVIVELRDGK